MSSRQNLQSPAAAAAALAASNNLNTSNYQSNTNVSNVPQYSQANSNIAGGNNTTQFQQSSSPLQQQPQQQTQQQQSAVNSASANATATASGSIKYCNVFSTHSNKTLASIASSMNLFLDEVILEATNALDKSVIYGTNEGQK